jgi:hypothetical protein
MSYSPNVVNRSVSCSSPARSAAMRLFMSVSDILRAMKRWSKSFLRSEGGYLSRIPIADSGNKETMASVRIPAFDR